MQQIGAISHRKKKQTDLSTFPKVKFNYAEYSALQDTALKITNRHFE